MLLIRLSFLVFFLSFIKTSFAQDSKVVAELHNIYVNNKSIDKTIHIRFLDCSKEEFDKIYSIAKQNQLFSEFRNNYVSSHSIGEVYFSKKTNITTEEIENLLIDMGIKQVMFNNKMISVENVSNYQFSEVERINHTDNLEK